MGQKYFNPPRHVSSRTDGIGQIIEMAGRSACDIFQAQEDLSIRPKCHN